MFLQARFKRIGLTGVAVVEEHTREIERLDMLKIGLVPVKSEESGSRKEESPGDERCATKDTKFGELDGLVAQRL